MLLSGFFLDLERRRIDAGDVCQLLYAMPSQKDIQGVINCLNYWCDEWKGKRFPTSLRIVYCLDHLKMIALPFLDTTIDQSKLWGIEIDNLFIYKKVFSRVSACDTGDVLRKCSYKTYQSQPGEGNPADAIRLPTAIEMYNITKKSLSFDATIHFLKRYGIDCDGLSYASYWTQELENTRPIGVSVLKKDCSLIQKQAAEAKVCNVRPVLSFFEGEGIFDYLGKLDKYCLPDHRSEKFAKKLSKK